MISAMLMGPQAASAITQDGVSGIIEETLAKAEQPNGVRLLMADPDHWALSKPSKGRRRALALRTDDGGEWIVVDKTGPEEGLTPLLQHELAHILAWRRYGEKIDEHGSQWARICRQLVQERQAEYCRRE